MAFRCRANDESNIKCWQGNFVIFLGVGGPDQYS